MLANGDADDDVKRPQVNGVIDDLIAPSLSDEDDHFAPSSLTLSDQDDDDDDGDLIDPAFVHEDTSSYGRQPDLYAVLGGLDRTKATQADIRAAYKRLSLALHPDKQQSGGDSSRAEAAFARLSSAYAVLNDPAKRAIYDAYGHQGLSMTGWQLATTEKSEAQLRHEYLLLKSKAEAEKQLQLTQPSSNFVFGLDASDFFDRFLKEPSDERREWPQLTVDRFSLSQSITAGLGLHNSLSLAGRVLARDGLGIGMGTLVWRKHFPAKHPFLPLSTLDTELAYGRGGRGLDLQLRLRRQFGRLTALAGCSLNARRHGRGVLIPGLSTGLSIQLTRQCQARVEWRWNSDPGLSTELAWSMSGHRSLRLTAELSPLAGRHSLGLRLDQSLDWAWLRPPLVDYQESVDQQNSPNWAASEDSDEPTSKSKQGWLSVGVNLNPVDAVELTLGLQCVLSSYSRLTSQLSVSLSRGLAIELTLLRGGSQSFSLPIKLSTDCQNGVAGAYGLLVPLLAYASVRALIYEPYIKRQLLAAQRQRRLQLSRQLKEARRQALATQSLLQLEANRRRRREAQLGGLVIVSAIYGQLTGGAIADGDDLTLDVTLPLQFAVGDSSQLRLPPPPASSKTDGWGDLQGFYDPCLGLLVDVDRQLRVDYLFHNEKHSVTVRESEGLAIPLAKHKVS